MHMQDDIEPLNMTHTPYNQNVWSLYKQEQIQVITPEGKLQNLLLDRLSSKNNEYMTVLTYYLVNGKITDNLTKAKFSTFLGLMMLRYDIKVVCLAMKSDSKAGDGDTVLIDFYKSLKMN